MWESQDVGYQCEKARNQMHGYVNLQTWYDWNTVEMAFNFIKIITAKSALTLIENHFWHYNKAESKVTKTSTKTPTILESK